MCVISLRELCSEAARLTIVGIVLAGSAVSEAPVALCAEVGVGTDMLLHVVKMRCRKTIYQESRYTSWRLS